MPTSAAPRPAAAGATPNVGPTPCRGGKADVRLATWRPERRTSVLPPAEGGRPTFGVPRGPGAVLAPRPSPPVSLGDAVSASQDPTRQRTSAEATTASSHAIPVLLNKRGPA